MCSVRNVSRRILLVSCSSITSTPNLGNGIRHHAKDITWKLSLPASELDSEALAFCSDFKSASPLDELVRQGAQQMLRAKIESEVADFLLFTFGSPSSTYARKILLDLVYLLKSQNLPNKIYVRVSMSSNRITIYSNGIAELRRTYLVEKPDTKISIPVRQEHLGDVLGSLAISGNVRLDHPPSYQPANVDDGKLSIDTSDALVSLASQLTGASVKVSFGQESIVGQLVGMHDQQIAKQGEPFFEKYLVVMVNGSINRVPIHDIGALEFNDPVIKSEIDKTLNRQLRKIKPNSTFVDFKLSPLNDHAEAIVRYTVPSAAWKICYRMILQDDEVELHGYAVVDNNTDEDWDNFQLTVITGQPITFSSDLADSKTPSRKHVNIVQESAVGAVEVDSAFDIAVMSDMASGSSKKKLAAKQIAAKKNRTRTHIQYEVDAGLDLAAAPNVSAQDVGDFCVYESEQPVSIAARRSALIPIFQTQLGNSKFVLHYELANHAERPFRAVEFCNTTGHSIGRGICSVVENSVYSGSCIVPPMSRDEERLMPYSVDSKVTIEHKENEIKRQRSRIQISNGVLIDEFKLECQTNYKITNNLDKDERLFLDHVPAISQSRLDGHLFEQDSPTSKLEHIEIPSGHRIEVMLSARKDCLVQITESKTELTQFRLTGSNHTDFFKVNWIRDNLFKTNSKLMDDPNLQACIDMQRQLDELDEQESLLISDAAKLKERQERLRENIKTGGSNSTISKWHQELAQSEDEIRNIEDFKLKELSRQKNEYRIQLFDTLNGLVIDMSH